MYYPNCQFCEHRKECVVVKALKEARETIWEYKGDFTYHCSYCDANIYTPRLSPYTYCPNCGAQMKGKHE